MLGVIGISLSLLVILGGLLLLAKSKKESLGSFYIFSSYSAIALGALLFAGSVVGSACMMRCHQGQGHHSYYGKGNCDGGSCKQGAFRGGHCEKGGHCAKSGQCSKGAMCGHGAACKGKSEKGGHGHGHKGGSCEHHGGEMHKKMMQKYHGGDSDVEVEIEEVESEE